MSKFWEVLEDLYDDYLDKREKLNERRKKYWKYQSIIILLALASIFGGIDLIPTALIITVIIIIVIRIKKYLNFENEYNDDEKNDYNDSKYEDDYIEYRKYDDRLR